MPRVAKPNNRTSIRFVSPDDTAISSIDGYSKYLETLDESHLGIKGDITPSFYYLKCLTLEGMTRLMSAVAPTDEDVGRNVFERLFNEQNIGEMRWFLEANLTGCTDHEEVIDVLPDGSFTTKSYAWKVGEARPEGLIDSVLADQSLTFNMFMFCTNAARLTEKEKKQ